MHALERLFILARPHAGTARRDPASGLTSVISVITRPAQPSDMLPRCIRCRSFAEPSSELYWHIGDTTTRLGSVRPRIVMGENRTLTIDHNSRYSC